MDENMYKNVTNKELIEELRYFGCDPYYNDLWQLLVNEIEERLTKS